MSSAVAKKIGLTYYQYYDGPPVATASVGSNLDIVGLIHSTTFMPHRRIRKRAQADLKTGHRQAPLLRTLTSRYTFLVEHSLDQLHSQGILVDVSEECQVSSLSGTSIMPDGT